MAEWTKERASEYKKEWAKKNRIKVNASSKKYKDANRLEINVKSRDYRRKNADVINASVNESRRALKTKAVEYMGGICVDCNRTFKACAFDFHHIGNKDLAIGGKFLRHWDDVKKELDKCILLCACCHRIRHDKSM